MFPSRERENQSGNALRRERKLLLQKPQQVSLHFSWLKWSMQPFLNQTPWPGGGILSVSFALLHIPHCKRRLESAPSKAHMLHRLLWKPAENCIKRRESMLGRQKRTLQWYLPLISQMYIVLHLAFLTQCFAFEVCPFGVERPNLFL